MLAERRDAVVELALAKFLPRVTQVIEVPAQQVEFPGSDDSGEEGVVDGSEGSFSCVHDMHQVRNQFLSTRPQLYQSTFAKNINLAKIAR